MANYYFHKATWGIDTDPKNGTKINVPMVFLLTPILGALFLMFLPVIGFYLLAETIFKVAYAKIVPEIGPQAVVGAAYLTGKPTGDAKKSDTVDEHLADLAKEIESRRSKV